MKQLYRDVVNAIGKYLITVLGGTGLFMLVTPLAGYLPYSDRPGPGWHLRPFQLEWGQYPGYVAFVVSWLLFTAIYGFLVALIILGVVRGSERLRAPPLIVRAAGGLAGGSLTFLLLAGASWYIAAALPVGIVGTLLGVYFGAVQLPQDASPRSAAA